MRVHRFFMHNPLRNYNYLIENPNTKHAIALDPLDAQQVKQKADELGLSITHIINTHEHPDHIGGNNQLVKLTGAKVYAHPNTASKLKHCDVLINDGEHIEVAGLEFKVLYIPGHTLAHIGLWTAEGQYQQHKAPLFFSGDTLMNAGVGNCHFGGDVQSLYHSVSEKIAQLAEDTLIFCGHDYLLSNLGFTLSIEADNQAAKDLKQQLANTSSDDMPVFSLQQECRHNVFLRLSKLPQLAQFNNEKELFIHLRSLRDNW